MNTTIWPLEDENEDKLHEYNIEQDLFRYSYFEPEVHLVELDPVAVAFGAGTTRVAIQEKLLQSKKLTPQNYEPHVQVGLQTFSSLSRKEHQEYIQLINSKRQARKSGFPVNVALSPEKAEILQKLELRVAVEQERFTRDLKDAAAIHKDKLAYLPENVHSLVNQVLQRDIHRCRVQYPILYTASAEIDLNSVEKADDCAFTYKRAITYKGACHTLEWSSISSLNDDVALNNVIDYPHLFSPNSDSTRISSDPSIPPLVQKYGIDAVMSSSTFLTLVCNHGPLFQQEWHLPATISLEQDEMSKGTRKCVIIDRELPPKQLTARQWFEKYYSKLISFNFLNPKKKMTSATSMEDTNPQERLQGLYSYHLWTLGTFRVLIRCKTKAFAETAGKDKNAQKSMQPMSFFCKLNYQLEQSKQSSFIQQESYSDYELMNWWMHAYLRQNAQCVLGHVDPISNTVFQVETLEVGLLLSRGCRYIDPLANLRYVHEVLKYVSELPVGKYMLAHELGKDKVVIYNAVDPLHNPMPDNQEAKSKQLDLNELLVDYVADDPSMDFVRPLWTSKDADRIPYTYPLPQYCPSFFRSGICDDFQQGKICRAMHIKENSKYSSQFHIYKLMLENDKVVNKFVRNYKPEAKFCRSFAYNNKCKADNKCKFAHITLDKILQDCVVTMIDLKRSIRRKSKRQWREMNKTSKGNAD